MAHSVHSVFELFDTNKKDNHNSENNHNAREVGRPPMSAYERTKAQVYATGNKWAIENFHATHD